MRDKALEMNLRISPKDTYLFDQFETTEAADAVLDKVRFYNEVKTNIKLGKFLKAQTLSRMFVPVATFNENIKDQDEELVALMEGVTFPFFGVAYSLQKSQFNFDLAVESHIDHSKDAISLAFTMANLFVDEARLNGNFFSSRKDEALSLISNYDSKLKTTKSTFFADDTQISEIYLF